MSSVGIRREEMFFIIIIIIIVFVVNDCEYICATKQK